MKERVAELTSIVNEMDTAIYELMKRREHLISTYKKSNRHRRVVICETVCDIDRKIISCNRIKYQTNCELDSLGVIK